MHKVRTEKTGDAIFFYHRLKQLTENDVDRHGKLPLVLLQFEQTCHRLETIVTDEVGPTFTKEPPAATTNHHLGFP
jgi:hypothetical protein